VYPAICLVADRCVVRGGPSLGVTMSRKSFSLAVLTALLSLAAYAQVSETRVLRLPQDIVFSTPNVVLYGDPTKSGMYVTRSKITAGTKIMPHWHAEERTVVILSGTLYYGLGEQWDESKLIAHPAGTFFSEPPRKPHFAWTKDGEVVLQVTAIGPAGTTVIQAPKP
jgi:quercetin dioxygenase-like cupin family protein